jgi:hypothetical protein
MSIHVPVFPCHSAPYWARLSTATQLQPNQPGRVDTGCETTGREAPYSLTFCHPLVQAETCLAGFRSLWAQARGGSNPLTRTSFEGILQ